MSRELGRRRRWTVWTPIALVAVAATVGLAVGMPEPAGCGGPDTGFTDQSPFDPSDNADDRSADSTTGYRSGCGAPIRTGQYALGGDVVTPQGVVTSAWVIVDGEKIASVTRTQPTGMPVVATGGYIFPGLIDGHGHVEYNHIPIADLGKRYTDRDQWPGASLYQTLVKDPKNAATAAGLQCEAVKHGEIRGLVGGTTFMQGTPAIACARSLVRNAEQMNFCQDKERQNVMDIVGFNRSISGKPSFADSIKTGIANGSINTVVVHAGEGIDDHAHAEWGQLKSLGLAVPQLVMIHAAAFNDADFAEAGQIGVKMVWSPLSNLLLYGQTANVPSAMAHGVLVSLGSDWAPSGSPNLLAELKVADHVNQCLWGGKISDEELVQMVTINPAIAFNVDKFVGTVEAGKIADLLVIAKPKTRASAYRALIDAPPSSVLLVTISGDPLFGAPAFLDTLGKQGDYELVDACGQQRGIDVTVTATDVTNGSETLATLESKLQGVNPKLTPIIDCTQSAMQEAFAGTPLATCTPPPPDMSGPPPVDMTTTPTTCAPVINEVLTGTSSSATEEFVELYNPCTTSLSLASWRLTYRSATNTTPVTNADPVVLYKFSTESMPAHGWLVLGGAGWSGASDGKLLTSVADHAGAIGLRDPTGELVDSVAYGTVTAGNAFAEGGAAAPAPTLAASPGRSLARLPDGHDTQHNAADFAIATASTAKSANE